MWFTEDTDEIFGEKLENGRTGHFNEKKIRETVNSDQRHMSGRPKHAPTEENLTAAYKLVLNQEDQPQTQSKSKSKVRLYYSAL